jgi:hypothetical protein
MPISTIDGSGLSQTQILSSVQLPTGSVLQVVNANSSTQVTTTSTSYISTGFSASITPKFSTSKILVSVHAPTTCTASGTGVGVQVWRGGSSIFFLAQAAGYNVSTGLAQNNTYSSGIYLDSPATTSSVTYTIYYASINPGTAYFCINSNVATITLTEIAA